MSKCLKADLHMSVTDHVVITVNVKRNRRFPPTPLRRTQRVRKHDSDGSNFCLRNRCGDTAGNCFKGVFLDYSGISRVAKRHIALRTLHWSGL